MSKSDQQHNNISRCNYIQAYSFRLFYLHPRFWGWWFGIGVIWVASHFSFKWIKKLARFTGKCLYRFARERNAIARKNLELCFPELSSARREALLKENCYFLALSVFDTGIAWFSSSEKISKLCEVQGIEHVRRSLSLGRGVLFCACHKLSLEMLIRIFSEIQSFSTLYRVHNNPVYEYVSGICRRSYPNPGNFIPRKNVRDLLHALRQGQIGVILADHDLGKRSIFVPFFGQMAATITSASDFSRLGKADVIMVDHYCEDNRYIVNFSRPLSNFPTDDKAADTALINREYEKIIRKTPGQYLWQHRRFKTRPTGQDPVYARKG